MTCDVDEPIWLRATLSYPATETEPSKPIPPEDIDKVVCTVLVPRSDGETLTPDVDSSEAEDGKYKARFVPSRHGEKWFFAFDAFDADGEPLGREEKYFKVRRRQVPRD